MKKAVLCAILGIPTLLGLAFLLGALNHCFMWQATSNWVAVPATVETVVLELHSKRSGKLRDVALEDATGPGSRQRYVIDTRYRYAFADEVHTASKVMQDPYRSAPVELFARLHAHHAAGTPVECFVDPTSPSDSVLFRDFPTGSFVVGGLASLVILSLPVGLVCGRFNRD